MRNCASICACFPSLHDALGLQRFDILFAQSHSVKDFGVVLAELGGDRTHTDAAVDLDQGADERDVAQFGVGGVLGAMARSGRDADSWRWSPSNHWIVTIGQSVSLRNSPPLVRKLPFSAGVRAGAGGAVTTFFGGCELAHTAPNR